MNEKKFKKRKYENPRKNASGANDPTAYNAIKHMTEEEIRHNKCIHTIFHICELAGFKVEGRIVLTDKETGRLWE